VNQETFDALSSAYQKLKVLHFRMKSAGVLDRGRDLLDLAKRAVHHIPLLRDCILSLSAQTYLEIGVAEGHCYSIMNAPRVLGVDPSPPAPKVLAHVETGKGTYYQLTSDDFFAHHASLFKAKKIDVAFIDGLHSYAQTFKDFTNCLQYLDDSGLILFHDCNPANEIMGASWEAYSMYVAQQKKRGESFHSTWCGDVWKTIAHLRATRDDLTIFTLDCDYGIAVVAKGIPESMIDFSPREIRAMAYTDLDQHRDTLLNLKSPFYIYDFLYERAMVLRSQCKVV
jgi:hypothetical protein